MSKNINCPSCDASYKVTEAMLGKKVSCKCGESFTINSKGSIKGSLVESEKPVEKKIKSTENTSVVKKKSTGSSEPRSRGRSKAPKKKSNKKLVIGLVILAILGSIGIWIGIKVNQFKNFKVLVDRVDVIRTVQLKSHEFRDVTRKSMQSFKQLTEVFPKFKPIVSPRGKPIFVYFPEKYLSGDLRLIDVWSKRGEAIWGYEAFPDKDGVRIVALVQGTYHQMKAAEFNKKINDELKRLTELVKVSDELKNLILTPTNMIGTKVNPIGVGF